jgi:hypothetical protein
MILILTEIMREPKSSPSRDPFELRYSGFNPEEAHSHHQPLIVCQSTVENPAATYLATVRNKKMIDGR